MENLVDKIENRIENEEVLRMYKAGVFTRAEALLLLSTEKDGFFMKFVNGIDEFRLYYDKGVKKKTYYTNVPEMLNAFYSLHQKYPNYHFDEILGEYMYIVSHWPECTYKVLTTIDYHLKYEKQNVATFKIKNLIEILNVCKNVIEKKTDYFKKAKRYEARKEKEGYYGIIKKYNEYLKEELDYEILPQESSIKKV